jgi:pyruvate/2-oxoglutarate dehydrogenase complex dihydrolipoamide acyltransferase (E2) component
VVAWGWVLHEALAAAEELATHGVEVEVIDPRSLNPLDHETLLASVRRTGRLCIVHEDTQTMGLGAEIAALAAEHALDDLRAPVQRIAMPDAAGIPASGAMEDFLIPDRQRIGAALRELARIDRPTHIVANGLARAESDAPSDWRSLLETSLHEVPQAASIVEIDLTNAMQRLEASAAAWSERGLGPTTTPLFAEALLAAVRAVPRANAAFDPHQPGIRQYRDVRLGLSVTAADGSGARHGVIADADTRNALGLALEAQRIAAEGASTAEVLARATISLTDFGPGSALFAVPMVVPGQAAALRVGAVEERVIARDRGFALAPTAYVCASIDHRVLDGVDAGALLAEMKRVLERAA